MMRGVTTESRESGADGADRIKMGEVCVCVSRLEECLREQVFLYVEKKGKMENAGRSRDRRHG